MRFLLLIASVLSLTSIKTWAQSNFNNVQTKKNTVMTLEKMKVKIWSDIMCPFCYIGKRHYEKAISQFAHANLVELEWHSYQLDPTIPKQVKKQNVYQYLADKKGMSFAQSEAMHKNVIAMAQDAGLNFNFDIAVVANSFDVHRVIQLAKKYNLGDEAEERFFKAYFCEGADVNDATTLIKLAKEIGLNEEELTKVVQSDEYTTEVKNDIALAQQIGVQGVPFFVFNRKYAVSGAQPESAFLEVLNKSFNEWKTQNNISDMEIIEGKVCTPEKDCE